MKLEILRCRDCGALAVSVNDTRVTRHQCSGRWTTALVEDVPSIVPVGREDLDKLRNWAVSLCASLGEWTTGPDVDALKLLDRWTGRKP